MKLGLEPFGSVGEWKRNQAETTAGIAEAENRGAMAREGMSRAGRLSEAGVAGAEAAAAGMGVQNRIGAAQAGVTESQARLQQIIAERTGQEVTNMTKEEFTRFLSGADPNTQIETLRTMADALRESQPEVAAQIDQMVLQRMGLKTVEEEANWNRGLAAVGSFFAYLMRGQPKQTRLVPITPAATSATPPASTAPKAPATAASLGAAADENISRQGIAAGSSGSSVLPLEAIPPAMSLHEQMNQVVAGNPVATPSQMVAAANVLKIQLQRTPSEEELAQYLTGELGLSLPPGS